MYIPFILVFRIVSRDFYLTYRDLSISMGSWIVVESNGTKPPSTFNSLGLVVEPQSLNVSK
jgi:hypothetical protein